jgi:hypothetical protein
MSLFFGTVLPVILIVLIFIMLFKSGAEIVAQSKKVRPRLPGETKPKSITSDVPGR